MPLLAGTEQSVQPNISDCGETWLTRGNPVDDAFADHDYRCMGTT